MTTSEHHIIDPNPVRPSSAEGDPDEELDDSIVGPDPHVSPDPHAERPSQAEGEPDEA